MYGNSLLPSAINSEECRLAGGQKCFKTGDVRSNEHVGLSAIHTIWVREHNRLAKKLKAINPHWGDEILFQESRRIIAAEIQHITYNEFLPMILGQVSIQEIRTTNFSFIDAVHYY